MLSYAGNSLDRALLLENLLKLARSRLNQGFAVNDTVLESATNYLRNRADAEKLSTEERLKMTWELLDKEFKSTHPNQSYFKREEAGRLKETLRDYWWVQIYQNNKWRDLANQRILLDSEVSLAIYCYLPGALLILGNNS